jgi:hypothetical protein
MVPVMVVPPHMVARMVTVVMPPSMVPSKMPGMFSCFLRCISHLPLRAVHVQVQPRQKARLLHPCSISPVFTRKHSAVVRPFAAQRVQFVVKGMHIAMFHPRVEVAFELVRTLIAPIFAVILRPGILMHSETNCSNDASTRLDTAEENLD